MKKRGVVFHLESLGGRVVSGRVNGLLSPSRAFGDLHVRQMESGDYSDCISPVPDLTTFEFQSNGFLVLSSDGVNDYIRTPETVNIIQEALQVDATTAARNLSFAASKLGHDDITVIVVVWSQ